MKRIPIAELKDDLSRLLRVAEREPIVITRHGKPAGVLIGFATEDDWFEYRLAHDARFQQRVAEARAQYAAGQAVAIETLED